MFTPSWSPFRPGPPLSVISRPFQLLGQQHVAHGHTSTSCVQGATPDS
jgi:hypothetical protein